MLIPTEGRLDQMNYSSVEDQYQELMDDDHPKTGRLDDLETLKSPLTTPFIDKLLTTISGKMTLGESLNIKSILDVKPEDIGKAFNFISKQLSPLSPLGWLDIEGWESTAKLAEAGMREGSRIPKAIQTGIFPREGKTRLESAFYGFLMPDEIPSGYMGGEISKRVNPDLWVASGIVGAVGELLTYEIGLGNLGQRLVAGYRASRIRGADKELGSLVDYMTERLVPFMEGKGAYPKEWTMADKIGRTRLSIIQELERVPALADYMLSRQTPTKILFNKMIMNKLGTLKFQPENVPLKSNLKAVAFSKLPTLVNATQAINTLMNASGLSKDELDFSGVIEYLKGKKGKVSRDEIVDYIEKNKVKINPIILSSEGYKEYGFDDLEVKKIRGSTGKTAWEVYIKGQESDTPIYVSTTSPNASGAKYEAIGAGATKIGGGAKYHTYTVPGEASNYQETLIQLPGTFKQKQFKVIQQPNGLFNIKNPHGGLVYIENMALKTKEEAQEALEQMKIGYEEHEGKYPIEGFQSPHFDEPGIVVHHRSDQRVDSKGKTGTFVHEIQSDWHLEGKKKGYGYNDPYTNFKKELIKKYKTRDEAKLLSLMTSEEDARLDRLSQEPTGNVPDVPFKNTWHELALKDIIRQAVERGDSFVAFASGQQVAELYDLTKQIDSIEYAKANSPDPNSKEQWYSVNAVRSGRSLYEKTLPESQLESFVGKDIARKILEEKGTEFYVEGIESVMEGKYHLNWKELKGEDLKIGGEWAKKFYDDILIKSTEKYIKKWGGKIEDIDIHEYKNIYPKGTVYFVFDSEGDTGEITSRMFEDYDEAVKFRDDNPGYMIQTVPETGKKVKFKKTSKMIKNKGFYLTPYMIKEVKEIGQPMFGSRLAGGLEKLLEEKGTAGIEGNEPIPDDWDAEPIPEIIKDLPTGEITKENIDTYVMQQLFMNEREYLEDSIIKGKSIKEIAKKNNETIEETQKEIEWAKKHYQEIVEEEDIKMREEFGKEEAEKMAKDKKKLRDYLKGKIRNNLQNQGEFANVKELKWLFAKPEERGFTPDELVTEMSGIGLGELQEGDDLIPYIEKVFSGEIKDKITEKYVKEEKQRVSKNIRDMKKSFGKKPKVKPEKKPEVMVGRGTVLSDKGDIDKGLQIEIMQKMPFSLLGNKAEVLSRLSTNLKTEIKKGVEKVFDLFGGAKGYRAGLFDKTASSKYALNEYSDERFNYYSNIKDPDKLKTMKKTVADLRQGLIDRIAKAFEIPTNKYSPEELRKALNKWLQRGMEKDRATFAREIIQKYGEEVLAEAVKDNFASPESSAAYYFLQNTSVFGLSNQGDKYKWSQGVIRTKGDKAEIRDNMRRIEEVDKQMDMEHERDKNMPVTQKDAWEVMDEITQDIFAGKVNPDEIVVLVDPQYLNPTAESGTYSVGQKDTTWEGHRENLEQHLLPLIQTGAKVIYTNNYDKNLVKWLKQNKLPYNVEESIGATANRGGRDEIISLINYNLPKEYTRRVGADTDGDQYAGEEITGESETFQKWLEERKRLEKEGLIKPPSFGKDWTPDQRREIYRLALRKGLIWTDVDKKVHDKLHPLLRYYKGATFDQVKTYIEALTGDKDNPPKVYKLTGDIDKDKDAIQIIADESKHWKDINAVEVNTLDPVRIIEKVTGQPIWETNSLADNTINLIISSDAEMFDRKVEELNILDANREGVFANSKESAEIMRKFEAKEPLTPKEQRIVDFLRSRYDALIMKPTKMRESLGRKPIPYRQDYMAHMEEQNLLSEFFHGNPTPVAKISREQLNAIRMGDYTKGNMPFNRFALQRKGTKTKYDAIGNYVTYLNTLLKEIYYTPAITHARKFIQYAMERQPNAYKSLDRLLNDLKGKPSVADQNVIGAFASWKPIKWLRSQMARSALVGNVNFWAMNLSNVTISYDELGWYLNEGMSKFLGDKAWRDFAFQNSKMLKGRAIDPDFLDKPIPNKMEEAVASITNIIEYNNVGSTFVGAYIKGIEVFGFSDEQAIAYADDIARRTQVGYKPYEVNAWMRSNAGKLYSQYQTWAFNAMNHILYDLGVANVPEDIASMFTDTKTNRARWGSFLALLGVAIITNAIYRAFGLREPYDIKSAIPSVAGMGSGKYSDIGPARIAKDISTIITAKKKETKIRAAQRVAGAFVPGGTQAVRFLQGKVFPESEASKKKKKIIIK